MHVNGDVVRRAVLHLMSAGVMLETGRVAG